VNKATEKCSCGATIVVDARSSTTLMLTLSEWRKNHQHPEPAKPEPAKREEPQPQGGNVAYAERVGESDRNHALNANDRPGHYGRAISLRWTPPGGEA
jgi:hypothetical protein